MRRYCPCRKQAFFPDRNDFAGLDWFAAWETMLFLCAEKNEDNRRDGKPQKEKK